MGTWIIGLVVFLGVALAAKSIVRDKKNGKSQCGNDCMQCSRHCH